VYTYFKALPIKTIFKINGTLAKKRSTATADLLLYSRWFWLGPNDLCIVGQHCSLSSHYFTSHLLEDFTNEKNSYNKA